MLKAFLSFLALSVVLITVSFAGLAYTGMSSMDSMTHDSLAMSHATDCQGDGCLNSSPITADAACLDHCLSVASNQTNAITPLSLSLIALIFFVLLLVIIHLPRHAPTQLTCPSRFSNFGTLLHHRHLATILIRD